MAMFVTVDITRGKLERKFHGWKRIGKLEISLHAGQPPQEHRHCVAIGGTAAEARMIYSYARVGLIKLLVTNCKSHMSCPKGWRGWPASQIMGRRYQIQWRDDHEDGSRYWSTASLLECLSTARTMLARDHDADNSLSVALRRIGLPRTEGSGWILPKNNDDARELCRDLCRRVRTRSSTQAFLWSDSLTSLCFGN
jgi:hypothetical protein